ncbi:MAG: hypothetical protein SFY67_16520 [Candidatus Melainabacteria bacterium]|nr:hypothetical protein [Candidatus Melainabacteria bacterium]
MQSTASFTHDSPLPSQCKSNTFWFVNPLFDTIFVCGGLMWLLFGFYQFVLPIHHVGALALILSVILAEAHVIATHVRLYETAAMRRRHKWMILTGPPIIVAILVELCLSPSLLSSAALIYVITSIHHGLRQCYGISLLYCRKQGFKLTTLDKQLISALMHLVLLFAVLRQFAYPAFAKSPLRGVNVVFAQIVPEWLVGLSILLLICLGSTIVFRLTLQAMRGQCFPWSSALLLLNASLVVIFSREIAGDLWIFVPGFFHGSQYLVVTFMSSMKSQKLAGAKNPDAIFSSSIFYILILLVVTALIYGGVPAYLRTQGVNFDVACAAVFLAMVLHHFYVDSKIWRSRQNISVL